MTIEGAWAFIKGMFLLIFGSIGWQGFLIVIGISALFAVVFMILQTKIDKKQKEVGMTKIGEGVLHDGRTVLIVHCNYCESVFVHIVEHFGKDDHIICHGRYEKPCNNSTTLSKLKENPYYEKIGPPWSTPC